MQPRAASLGRREMPSKAGQWPILHVKEVSLEPALSCKYGLSTSWGYSLGGDSGFSRGHRPRPLSQHLLSPLLSLPTKRCHRLPQNGRPRGSEPVSESPRKAEQASTCDSSSSGSETPHPPTRREREGMRTVCEAGPVRLTWNLM